MDITDDAVIGRMFRDTPGGCEVDHGGEVTHGHFEDIVDELFDERGPVAYDAVLTIPSRALPGIGMELPSGRARGIGEHVCVRSTTLGELEFVVRALGAADSPGELRLFLANR